MLFLNHAFTLPVGECGLACELTLPQQATGLIVHAHSTSSHRTSARCRYIRRLLQQQDLGTLSVDLLTPREKHQSTSDSACALLTQRLVGATQWARKQASLTGLRIGLLGEDETATVVLDASLELNPLVGATVSFGGYLVQAVPTPLPVPTLLLLGETNAAARRESRNLGSPSQIRTVAHADPLFQDHSALAQATQQAAAWFTTYLSRPSNAYSSRKSS